MVRTAVSGTQSAARLFREGLPTSSSLQPILHPVKQRHGKNGQESSSPDSCCRWWFWMLRWRVPPPSWFPEANLIRWGLWAPRLLEVINLVAISYKTKTLKFKMNLLRKKLSSKHSSRPPWLGTRRRSPWMCRRPAPHFPPMSGCESKAIAKLHARDKEGNA